MPDAPAKTEFGDPDVDSIWGLLQGSAERTEVDVSGGASISPSATVEKEFPVERELHGEFPQPEDTTETVHQKELVFSIISCGPWRRVGRFPFILSSCSEASIPCSTPLTVADQLWAQLYDEDGEEVCDTGLVSMVDEDWACLNCAGDGSADPRSTRLLSCTKECGRGWSVSFDVKQLPEGSSVSHVLRFVRVAKSRSSVSHTCEHEHYHSSIVLRASDVKDCLDCTDAAACKEASLTPSRIISGIGQRSSMHDVLQRLALLDEAQLPARLLQPGLWTSMSRGVSMQGEIQRGQMNVTEDCLEHASAAFRQSGFSMLEGLAWEQAGISPQAVAATVQSLGCHGFPPVFIFMYDEPWLLFEKLFKVAADVLCCGAVEMDSAVFAWALRPAGQDGAVGSNFSRPHRDCSYDACHTELGSPSAMSVWIPLVHVTTDSGCMYVVPSEPVNDPLFDKSTDSRHMCPDQQLPWAHIKPLPCSAGDVLLWQGNLIHWGSACSKNAVHLE
ncbi:unnamed protein product [Prorocentrum cordatum]|uniref:Phytanoyl-CoA dioxygenase n=1 Tax=Prorocentrum cordatum TaxID=2364126 RepID=A0ABN9U4W9_9DINO|nr:unnamed protein product [Polarella glacialis]